MAKISNLSSFIRLGFIHPGLMYLAFKVKRSKRTFLSYTTLYSLVKNFITVRERFDRSLIVAEFGVGRGGSATILAWLVEKYKGKLVLFDVFGRIPAPTEQDGDRANQRYEYILKQEKEDYYGNIDNLLGVILNELHEVCSPERIETIKGKYEDMLPESQDRLAFDDVHIDCDWYESSKVVYDYLETRLRPGAIIQVDDYSNWQGSRQAFDGTKWLAPYHTHIVDGALVVDTARKK